MKSRLAHTFRELIPVFLLYFAMFSLFASCNSIKPAAMIILNGNILTMDSTFTSAEALAIQEDKILAVGSNKEIRKLADRQTKVIDAGGRTVIPGIIDAHLHPGMAALSELEEPIPDIRSMDELLAWIESQTRLKEEGKWIVFPKFFFTRLVEMRQPSLSDLDLVAPRHPVFLNGSFGGMINSAAMQVSGISEKTVHPGVLKDELTGKPTGFIRASAFSLLKQAPPQQLSPEEYETAFLDMLKRYNQCGITSLCSGADDLNGFALYKRLGEEGRLSVRIHQNIILRRNTTTKVSALVEEIRALDCKTGDGDEWARIGAVKVFLDGGILTGTAYLREPWGEKAEEVYGFDDTAYRGIVNYSKDELLEIVSAALERNWKFTAHCTGGGGVDLLLDVYEEVNRIHPIQDRRFSIIHGNFFTPQAIQRMSELGVYADMQAAWFYKDADAMRTILGEERIRHFLPYRSLIDAGVLVNGGSDHMVKWDANTSINPYNPFLAMWAMITRTTERNSVILPQEAITRMEALQMYTINNAHASFEEELKGSLVPGKLADLVLLSDDFLNCPVDRIRDIRADMTLVGGKIVYRSGDMAQAATGL